MGSNNIKWQFSNPASDGFNIELIGAFAGDGLHVHQHTGNPGANTHLAHFEAVDADVLPLCLVHATAKQLRISNVLNTKFVDFTLDASEDLTIDPSGTGKVIINSAFDVQGNITTTGTVDGIDIATDVAANTTHRGLSNNPHSTEMIDDTTPELGGEMDAGAHTIGFTQQTATGDGTTTIDWKLGNKFFFTFGNQNDTFTFTAPSNPCSIILVLKQYSTGGKLATWPGTVKWPGGVAPTLSTGNNAVDIIAFYYDGTNYFGVDSLDFS